MSLGAAFFGRGVLPSGLRLPRSLCCFMQSGMALGLSFHRWPSAQCQSGILVAHHAGAGGFPLQIGGSVDSNPPRPMAERAGFSGIKSRTEKALSSLPSTHAPSSGLPDPTPALPSAKAHPGLWRFSGPRLNAASSSSQRPQGNLGSGRLQSARMGIYHLDGTATVAIFREQIWADLEDNQPLMPRSRAISHPTALETPGSAKLQLPVANCLGSTVPVVRNQQALRQPTGIIGRRFQPPLPGRDFCKVQDFRGHGIAESGAIPKLRTHPARRVRRTVSDHIPPGAEFSDWRVPTSILASVHDVPDACRQRVLRVHIEIIHSVFPHGVQQLMDNIAQGCFFGKKHNTPSLSLHPLFRLQRGCLFSTGLWRAFPFRDFHEETHRRKMTWIQSHASGGSGRDDPQMIRLTVWPRLSSAVIHLVKVFQFLHGQLFENSLTEGLALGIASRRRVAGVRHMKDGTFFQLQ